MPPISSIPPFYSNTPTPLPPPPRTIRSLNHICWIFRVITCVFLVPFVLGLSRWLSTGVDLRVISILSIFTILTAPCIWEGWITPSRRRRLYVFGQATIGKINAMEPHEETLPIVEYTFVTLSGLHIQGRIKCESPKLFDHFHIGQTITVLYDQDNPQRNVAYEAGAYEVIDELLS